MALDFSLRFLIVLGSILVPFWPPKWHPGGPLSCANRPWGGPRRSQDRLGSVLFSSCRSGSLFWSSWAPLGVVFGRSGGRFGAFSAFQLMDSTHQLINSSIQPINPSIHQLIDSTHQPINPSTHRFNPSTHQPINSSINRSTHHRFNPSTHRLIDECINV